MHHPHHNHVLQLDIQGTPQAWISLEHAAAHVEVAHTKLAASRAFWLKAYPAQSHEMLFDAHAHAFAAFGGIPRRGIYDNMKTAVDKVGVGKQRSVNVRFLAMCSHYLFEPEFCNPASGWEKGVVEKNVQDRRRQIWREVAERRWSDLTSLNAWLATRCRQAWEEMAHPEWPELKVAEVWQDERLRLMVAPKPFDGYVEQPVRVSATALVHFQRNRYSVPTRHVNQVLSLRVYPGELVLVADGIEVARHPRSFERDQNCHHNYVSREHHFGKDVFVTRKGAVSAKTGQLGIIPGSMGARSYIVRGKGNPDSRAALRRPADAAGAARDRLARRPPRGPAAQGSQAQGERSLHRGHQLAHQPGPGPWADRRTGRRRLAAPRTQPADHRRHRQRQDLAGLRTGTPGRPQRLLGAVRARGTAVR